MTIKCSHCGEVVPYNQIEVHEYGHLLQELACIYCGTLIKGQQAQIDHHKTCGDEELVCKCGESYQKKAKDSHVCEDPASWIARLA